MLKSFCLLPLFLAGTIVLFAQQTALHKGVPQHPRQLDYDKELGFIGKKLLASALAQKDSTKFPRNVNQGDSVWHCVGKTDWCSGFFCGQLWYLFQTTHKPEFKQQAMRFTAGLEPNKTVKWTHDLGFMMYCPFGNGYRLSKKPEYKAILLETAASLATLYNPKVKTIKSWTWRKEWQHPTIIDNMMNLELLFWAAKNGGSKEYYNIAYNHAKTTLKYHIRPDYTTYHVVNYDTATGKPLNRITDQGLNDSSQWSRGEAWAIYGFALAYRETKDKSFLEAAEKLADVFIKHLPQDRVPYWDFNAPQKDPEPRDASAAAVAASGLLELAQLEPNAGLKNKFNIAATEILQSLAGPKYSTKGRREPSILLHCTGSKPHKSEIDVSLIYADYYYTEALLKHKRWIGKMGE